MNHGWIYRERVDRAAEGWTVLDYYTSRYRHSSRAEWQTRIAAGQILLNQAPATAQARLKQGDCLLYSRPPWQEPLVPLSFTVVYEDSDLLVVAKPAGLPVLPGGGFLEHTLLWQLQQRYPASKQQTPIPIHRLGRGTSGLVLLARSSAARAALSQQMRTHQIEKIYRALACGNSMPDRFSVTQAIGKVPHPVLGYVYAAHPQGLFAQSNCQVLRRDTATALLEVNILTGRPHQIRIHLAAVGHPLLGDPLYSAGGLPIFASESGELPVPGDCGYHLHAMHLAFTHPTSHQEVRLTCPAPAELEV